MSNTKPIKVGYSFEIDGKKYGDFVTIVESDLFNKDYKDEARRKIIDEVIKETFVILGEAASDSIQKVLTGKTTTDDILEEGRKLEKEMK